MSPPVFSLGSPSSGLFVDRRWDSIKNSYLTIYSSEAPGACNPGKIFSTCCLCWMYKRMNDILLL